MVTDILVFVSLSQIFLYLFARICLILFISFCLSFFFLSVAAFTEADITAVNW